MYDNIRNRKCFGIRIKKSDERNGILVVDLIDAVAHIEFFTRYGSLAAD